MRHRYDAIVLMGPPGAGKSFLGGLLAREGIASYRELEPLLRKKFGAGKDFQSRILEAGAFLWASYRDQLGESELVVAFESAGILDRPLLERLQRHYRVALIHVRTDRSLCIERAISRSRASNIAHTDDREAIGRHHDLWYERIFPTYRFDLCVDGAQAGEAAATIRGFLHGST